MIFIYCFMKPFTFSLHTAQKMKFFIFPLTEEILNRKLHFLCSGTHKQNYRNQRNLKILSLTLAYTSLFRMLNESSILNLLSTRLKTSHLCIVTSLYLHQVYKVNLCFDISNTVTYNLSYFARFGKLNR